MLLLLVAYPSLLVILKEWVNDSRVAVADTFLVKLKPLKISTVNLYAS